MILSTKGRYGLKAAFELALSYGDGPVPLKRICDKYDISENYLEQLFSKLKKSGYINTTRGVNGGYSLAKEPKDITVGMILRALEGEITASNCVSKESCSREAICATRTIWEKIESSINNVIDNISLLDMVEDKEDKLEKNTNN